MTRINHSSNYTIIPPGTQPPGKREKEVEQRENLRPPRSRGIPFIPEDSVLHALIERGVAALKHGMVWDRGSIINIEV